MAQRRLTNGPLLPDLIIEVAHRLKMAQIENQDAPSC